MYVPRMFIQSCKHCIVLYHVNKKSFHFCELYWVPFRLVFLHLGLPGEYGEWTPTSQSLPEREGSGGSSQAHDRGEGVSIFRKHSKANGFNSPRSPFKNLGEKWYGNALCAFIGSARVLLIGTLLWSQNPGLPALTVITSDFGRQ